MTELIQLRFMLIVLKYIIERRIHPDIKNEAIMMAREIQFDIRKKGEM